jgi:hypothetical protein
MKVVAIKDANITKKKWPNGTHQAYFIGDVFDIVEWGDEYKRIKYKCLDSNGNIHENIIINEKNFISLKEWRELQINKLGL